jgi:hypothetical protein
MATTQSTATIRNSDGTTTTATITEPDKAAQQRAAANSRAQQATLQHLLVKSQIGNDLLESEILVFELSEPSQFGSSQTGELPLPVEKRRLRNADLAAHLGDWNNPSPPASGRKRSVAR